jgi:molybdopterin synthase sulfur carrier subunit
MKVHLKAFASFKDILGNEKDVDVKEGSSFGELLKDLSSKNTKLKDAVFDETGQLRDYVILMKNRKSIEHMEGLNTKLSEGDEVAILPPVAGG